MKNVLIASFDMEVGGVERSLVSLMNNFDYKNHQVDLMLYSHTGDFMNLIPKYPNLLDEMKPYKTFRMTIVETIKSGNLFLGLARLRAKYDASKITSGEDGYRQMQYMWKYSLPFLPKLEKKYDIAISYLWPHYFVAEKVQATKKIAWIHTDFSTVDTDRKLDLQIWGKFDHMIAVSEECRNAFIEKYPTLENKVLVMENITSPDLVRSLAEEKVNNPMLQDPRFKLITVARLSHAKGIDNAVRAFKLLKDKGYQDIVWYVVGYGGDEDLIRTMINKNDLTDCFILLGKKLNPYPYMKAADLYVQPSRYEGKAVTVGEAQILGKPVLITKYPTARSQVQEGFDGLICDLSTDGIASGIETIFNSLSIRNALSINCVNTNYENKDQLEKMYKLMDV